MQKLEKCVNNEPSDSTSMKFVLGQIKSQVILSEYVCMLEMFHSTA